MEDIIRHAETDLWQEGTVTTESGDVFSRATSPGYDSNNSSTGEQDLETSQKRGTGTQKKK